MQHVLSMMTTDFCFEIAPITRVMAKGSAGQHRVVKSWIRIYL